MSQLNPSEKAISNMLHNLLTTNTKVEGQMFY